MTRTVSPTYRAWRRTITTAGALALTALIGADAGGAFVRADEADEPRTTPGAPGKADKPEGTGKSDDADTPGKPDKPAEIDFAKARELFRRRQSGERLTDDEEAYIRKAMEARRAMEERRARNSLGVNQPPRRPTNVTPRETIGQKPLSEMSADDRYKGEDGGLYGQGRNEPPAKSWFTGGP